MRSVTGIMNGIVECDLCAEICLLCSSEHKLSMNYHTMSYMLHDGLSEEELKKMFCGLFQKVIELRINDMERVEKITVLEKARNEVIEDYVRRKRT